MPYAPQWLVELFLREVKQGRHPFLPPFDYCYRGSSSMCLLTYQRRYFHSPSICPQGKGIVWQPRHSSLCLPRLTPFPNAFIERFIRQRVLEPKLFPVLVDCVMSFLEDVYTVPIYAPTPCNPREYIYSAYHSTVTNEPPSGKPPKPPVAIGFKSFSIFKAEQPCHQKRTNVFQAREDMNGYFAKHGIQGLSRDEIGHDLDVAIAEFESIYGPPIQLFQALYEPKVVDVSSSSSDDESSDDSSSE